MQSASVSPGCGLLPTYHLLAERETKFIYSSTAAQFDAHLTAVAALGRSASELAVSFDDGHASQYRYAFPLLEKHGPKAIFFCVADWVDRRSDAMSSAQLRELLACGHRVQSHGLTHCMLTRCSEQQLSEELSGSRRELEQRLGTAIDAISIPFGRWDRRVLRACAAAGYRQVYISEPAPLPRQVDGMKVWGRFMVRRSTKAAEIEGAMLATAADFRLQRAAEQGKRMVRALVGEETYHAIWGWMRSRRALEEAGSFYERQAEPR